jgi:hypothetical protein
MFNKELSWVFRLSTWTAVAPEAPDITSGNPPYAIDSAGLYCPRWSPDGRYISATKADGRELMLNALRFYDWEMDGID